jgi:hypothetical protein
LRWENLSVCLQQVLMRNMENAFFCPVKRSYALVVGSLLYHYSGFAMGQALILDTSKYLGAPGLDFETWDTSNLNRT